MKGLTIRRRTARLIGTDIDAVALPLVLLADFAAQNPGLEPRNYYDPEDLRVGRRHEYLAGVRAYRSEARNVAADWRRFVTAWEIARQESVTAEAVIEASKSAFSGRLTWDEAKQRWDYTTGQYWPTEYRKAAASVLEQATRATRRARTPQRNEHVRTIDELIALNRANGGCWFDKAETRFFGSRIESGILPGGYFISSEQREVSEPRRFTIRSFDAEGNIGTVGQFHSHPTKRAALKALHVHLTGSDGDRRRGCKKGVAA